MYIITNRNTPISQTKKWLEERRVKTLKKNTCNIFLNYSSIFVQSSQHINHHTPTFHMQISFSYQKKKTQLGSILFSTVLATSLDFWHSRQQTDTQMRHMFSQSGLTAFPLFHSVEYTNMQRHLLHR